MVQLWYRPPWTIAIISHVKYSLFSPFSLPRTNRGQTVEKVLCLRCQYPCVSTVDTHINYIWTPWPRPWPWPWTGWEQCAWNFRSRWSGMSTINVGPSLFQRPNHIPKITKPCDTPLVPRATFSRAIWIILKTAPILVYGLMPNLYTWNSVHLFSGW